MSQLSRSSHGARCSAVFPALLLTAVAVALPACREEGSISLNGSSAQSAISENRDVTLGTVAYTVVKLNIEKSTDNGPAKLVELENERANLIGAIDSTVPAEVAGGLRGTLQDVIRLVRNGTLPALSRDLAGIVDLFISDPEDPQDTRLAAALAMAQQKQGLDRSSLIKIVGRLVAYPEIETFLTGLATMARENDGLDAASQPTAAERDLVGELLGVVSRILKNLERPAANAGASGPSPLNTLLLQEIQLRGLQVGGPAWAVRRDAAAFPKVARRTDGRLHFPFVDRDGDGLADRNAAGDAIDASGQAIDIPAFGEQGVRDPSGRALADTGDPLYEYFDVKSTPLGQAARMLGDLIQTEAILHAVRAVDRVGVRQQQIDPQTGTAFPAYRGDNPLLDLAWGGLEIFRYRDAPKLLDAAAALIGGDPQKAEEVLVKLLEAIKILDQTPALPSTAAASGAPMLDTLLPLLDTALEVNSQGQSPARLLLHTFSQEQRRLQNLPQGLAVLMKYSDLASQTLVQPGQASLLERLLDMMAEANQCDSWPFGNMAVFYLEAMAGEKRILGIPIRIGTVNRLLDISFLRSLLCNKISESNIRALQALSQSGALDALVPLVKVFAQSGELVTLKDIMLAMQASYPSAMRPYEPKIVQVLESGAVEKLFEVFDDTNQVRVPGTGELVSDTIADFLEAFVDDDRVVRTRSGGTARTLLHLLIDPLDQISARLGPDPALGRAVRAALDVLLETTTDAQGNTVMRNHALIPLAAAALEQFADSMSLFPWTRSADITRYQQGAIDFFTGRDLPVIVDAVLAIESSSSSDAIIAALANLLTPNPAVREDAYGAILEAAAVVIQTETNPRAFIDLARFAGRAIDPARGYAKSIVLGVVELVDGPGGATIVTIVQNALDRGESGGVRAPIEILMDIAGQIDSLSLLPAPALTNERIRDMAREAVEFIRDADTGLERLWLNMANSPL